MGETKSYGLSQIQLLVELTHVHHLQLLWQMPTLERQLFKMAFVIITSMTPVDVLIV